MSLILHVIHRNMTAERSQKLAGGKRSATAGHEALERAVIPKGSQNANPAPPAEFPTPDFFDPSGIGDVLSNTTGGAPPATTGQSLRSLRDGKISGIGLTPAAAKAIADVIPEPELRPDYIVPSVFDRRVSQAVAAAVSQSAVELGVARRQLKSGVSGG